MSRGRARGRPRRPPDRRHNALQIRADWLAPWSARAGGFRPHSPEAIHRELRARRGLIDRAMAPFDLAQLRPAAGLLTLGGAAIQAAVSAEQLALGAGAVFIADFWFGRRWRGYYLPRLVTHGEPWEIVSPNELHVLDLPRPLIQRALRRSPRLDRAIKEAGAVSGPALAAAERNGDPRPTPEELGSHLEAWISAILALVTLDPPGSALNGTVGALRYLLALTIQNGNIPRRVRKRCRRLLRSLDAPLARIPKDSRSIAMLLSRLKEYRALTAAPPEDERRRRRDCNRCGRAFTAAGRDQHLCDRCRRKNLGADVAELDAQLKERAPKQRSRHAALQILVGRHRRSRAIISAQVTDGARLEAIDKAWTAYLSRYPITLTAPPRIAWHHHV